MNFHSAKEANVIMLFLALLDRVGVQYDRVGILKKLRKHPDFPGLSSVKDCLANYRIGCIIFTAINPEKTLKHVRLPCVAQTKTDDYDFILIERIAAETIFYSSEKQLNQAQPISDFLKQITGVFLELSPSNGCIKTDFKANRQRNKIKEVIQIGCLCFSKNIHPLFFLVRRIWNN